MEEKMYKIKKGEEINFYSTEPSITINKIIGNSIQKTRDSNNLYDVEKATINNAASSTKSAETGTITMNLKDEVGTCSIYYIIDLKPNTSYTMKYTYTGAVAASSGGINNYLWNGTDWEYYNAQKQFTTNNTGRVRIILYGKYNAATTNGTSKFSNIELIETSKLSESTEFKQYGNMPSIEIPSPIESLGSNINMYDYSNIVNSTNSSIQIENKELIITRTGTGGMYIAFTKENFIVGEKYTIKANADIYLYKDNIYGSLYKNGNAKDGFTFKAEQNKYVVSIIIGSAELEIGKSKNIGKVKLEKGEKATGYTDHGCGGIDYKTTGKNTLKIDYNVGYTVTNNGVTSTINADKSITLNGTATNNFWITLANNLEIQKGKHILSLKNKISGLGLYLGSASNTDYAVTQSTLENSKEFDLAENTEFDIARLRIISGTVFNNLTIYPMLINGAATEEYESYKEITQTIQLPEGVELCSLPNGFKDYIDNNGVIHKNTIIKEINANNTSFISFTLKEQNVKGVIVNKGFNKSFALGCAICEIATQYSVNECSKHIDSSFYENPSNFVIVLNADTTLEQAQEKLNGKKFIYQTEAEDTTQSLADTEIEKMINMPVIVGENNLTVLPVPSETTILYYDERTEEEKIEPLKITNNGKLLPFGFTIDYSKTDLPLMAEAIEASQTITGADGDVVLDTTYGPRPFEITAVTEDFLTPSEKEAKREEVRKYLNSIKKVNTKLIIEPMNRTFEVKYAGIAEDNNLPKCVEFIIPLKSSSSYAISNTDYSQTGKGQIESETIEPVGFVCTIEGPAVFPKVSLNGYLMAYENSILEGQKLIIDTKKSTVTHINANGTKTNAMIYYNHQFPKINNGINELNIVSGVENEKLKIEWNDYLL